MRTPGRMVEAVGQEGVEGILAGVATRAVPAVVPEGDGLGQGDVQPTGPGDGRGHLRHLERVGEPGALVVRREDEDLCLAGQAAEGGGVEDPVAVAFEAGAPRVGVLGHGAIACPARTGGPGSQEGRLEFEALRAVPWSRRRRRMGRTALGWRTDAGVRVLVSQPDRPRVAGHRGCPAHAALRPTCARNTTHVVQSARSL